MNVSKTFVRSLVLRIELAEILGTAIKPKVRIEGHYLVTNN